MFHTLYVKHYEFLEKITCFVQLHYSRKWTEKTATDRTVIFVKNILKKLPDLEGIVLRLNVYKK